MTASAEDYPATLPRVIKAIGQSYWFHPNAEVLYTDCGIGRDHRHLRFSGTYKVGDTIGCPFCADDQRAEDLSGNGRHLRATDPLNP